MNTQTVASLVRAHIMATRPPETRETEITETSLLVDTGILDSVAVFELVAFLEHRFGILVPDEELNWKNFETVAAITQLVETKLAAAGSS